MRCFRLQVGSVVVLALTACTAQANSPTPTASSTPSATTTPTAPSQAAWTSAGAMVDGRVGHTATLLQDGRVLVAGGFNATSDQPTFPQVSLASAELFDPATGWSAAAPMQTSRANYTAARLPDGTVLVAGGFGPDGHRTATAERYDPKTNAWQPAATLRVGRVNHVDSLLPDGRVLIVGGRIPSGPIAAAEIYDPVTNAWSRVADMQTPRESPSATTLLDGRVLVVGGRTADTGLLAATATGELFDPHTNTWSAAASMRVARAYHSATLLASGKVLIAGNAGDEPASAELYDPATNSWSPAGNMTQERRYPAAVRLNNGQVLVAGGFQGSATAIVDAERYDPGSNGWVATAPMQRPRGGAVLTLLADGRALVTGSGVRAEIYSSAA